MTKIIEGDWVMEKDEVINDDLIVKGNISGKDGMRYNLKCRDLKCNNLDCWDLKCNNLGCWDLKCNNLGCWDLKCENDISYYAVCFAYYSIKCKSIQGRRENSRHFVLDGKLIINGKEVKT